MTLTQLRAKARKKVYRQLTSADYSDAEVDDDLNEWYRTIVGWIICASGIWEFNGEQSSTDLVLGQAEYVLPTSMVYINRVMVKYPNSSGYVTATRFDDKETNAAFPNSTNGIGSTSGPFFREFDNSIILFPTPTAGVVGGLIIETVNDITELVSGSDVPNMNPLIQSVISDGAALEYCESEDYDSKAARIRRRIFGTPGGDGKDGRKYQIEQLAANRDKTTPSRIVVRRTSYR